MGDTLLRGRQLRLGLVSQGLELRPLLLLEPLELLVSLLHLMRDTVLGGLQSGGLLCGQGGGGSGGDDELGVHVSRDLKR